MAGRNKLLETLKMPIGVDAKTKLDDFLNEHLNMPLADAGYEDAGAALSALLSSAGELAIPDNLAEAALAAVPGARLMKAGKGLKKLVPGLEKAGAIDYKAIQAAEKQAANVGREASEKTADTLFYTQPGEMVKIKSRPDLYDTDLRAAEKAARK